MTMLYIEYTGFVSCCCREDFFIYFHYKSMVDNDMPGAWPVWTSGAPLAAFIKESIIHWSTQHMKALCHLVSEKKIFLCFSHNAPGVGPAWTPGAWLAGFVAGFIKRTTLHCYTQNMKALGLVVSEKRIFLSFSHDAPGAGPVWTPGAPLAGFIKRTTIHCYKQNMKALGLVVSERKIFLCFTNDAPPPGRGPYGPQGHGWQDL